MNICMYVYKDTCTYIYTVHSLPRNYKGRTCWNEMRYYNSLEGGRPHWAWGQTFRRALCCCLSVFLASTETIAKPAFSFSISLFPLLQFPGTTTFRPIVRGYFLLASGLHINEIKQNKTKMRRKGHWKIGDGQTDRQGRTREWRDKRNIRQLSEYTATRSR